MKAEDKQGYKQESVQKADGYFPMFFNIKGKRILIVGAGNIALRRVETLLSFGAEVTVAAPVWKEQIGRYQELGQLNLVSGPYMQGMIGRDYFMVIAATDDSQLNREICLEGKRQGILVNNASDKSQCDFYFPAIVRQGDVIAGVCAGGKDHGLVRKVAAGMRSWLQKFMEGDYING